jgi:hypothetical protein
VSEKREVVGLFGAAFMIWAATIALTISVVSVARAINVNTAVCNVQKSAALDAAFAEMAGE